MNADLRYIFSGRVTAKTKTQKREMLLLKATN